MTRSAQGNSVRNGISHIWMFGPRLKMVGMEPPASDTTILASPSITIQDRATEGFVLGAIEVHISEFCCTASPIGMAVPSETFMDGWAMLPSALFQPFANCVTMALRKSFAFQGFCNMLALARRKNSPLRGGLSSPSSRNFATCLITFSRIVLQVTKDSTARPRAKPFAITAIRQMALFTHTVNLFHISIVSE